MSFTDELCLMFVLLVFIHIFAVVTITYVKIID